MNIKTERIITIKKIISSQKVGSQDELLLLLEKNGIFTTQATLSRDLKILKVARIPNSNGGYYYALSDNNGAIQQGETIEINNISTGTIESIEFSGQLAVIKTRPGFANGIASMIDNSKPYEILGTIAGDDTILVINREGVQKQSIIDALSLILPGIKKTTK